MRYFNLYYCILCVAHLFALPVLFLLSFKQKYKSSLKARFFKPMPLPKHLRFHWIHACSFGEVQSLQTLVATLQTKLKAQETILITTTTQTGFHLANTLYPNCIITYLPFETFIPFWLNTEKIITLTLIEAELWLMPLFCAKNKGAKTILLNARISARSYPRYLRFRFFYAKLFNYIDKVFCQTKEDKLHLESLNAKNIEIFGNLKATEIPQITQFYKRPNQPLWIIASTHVKNNISEEVLILQAILKTFYSNKDLTLRPHFLFAPRHPERFLEVERNLNAILALNNLPLLCKTSLVGIQNSMQSPFILLDALGVLKNLYAIAEGVILGGSFLPNIGGHNPIEPAFFHTKLISGPYIFNQQALFNSISNAVLCDIEDLPKALQSPLKPTAIIQKPNITQLLKEY